MVNNAIAAALGMSETELFDTAEKNMSRLFEVNVTNLFDYVYGQLKDRGMSDEQISDLLGGDVSRLSDGYPWIVQNTSNNGATVLLNTEVFKELSDQVEGNLISFLQARMKCLPWMQGWCQTVMTFRLSYSRQTWMLSVRLKGSQTRCICTTGKITQ